MDERDDAARLAPRERTTGLSAAILRIGATLDLDTVLNKVVESARAPTGAAYGVIATVDEGGEPRDFVTSGFTPEEHRTMEAWPDRPALSADDAAMPDRSKMPPPRRVSAGLFEHFRALPGPLRVDNLSGYVRALGIEQDTAAPGYERRGEPAAPDGECGRGAVRSRDQLNPPSPRPGQLDVAGDRPEGLALRPGGLSCCRRRR